MVGQRGFTLFDRTSRPFLNHTNQHRMCLTHFVLIRRSRLYLVWLRPWPRCLCGWLYNNRIELCVTDHNRDSGLQLGRHSSNAPQSEWPANNLILNCTSFDNFDPDNGEDADGFACKLTTGPGNVFRVASLTTTSTMAGTCSPKPILAQSAPSPSRIVFPRTMAT